MSKLRLKTKQAKNSDQGTIFRSRNTNVGMTMLTGPNQRVSDFRSGDSTWILCCRSRSIYGTTVGMMSIHVCEPQMVMRNVTRSEGGAIF